ncbi:MAG: hypothetical protein A3I77_06020 [Gammaproteobacteria bacterium RIFCSPLOWO2_02_FULL_42_14]|nr:MAG: hypothetical protein A3B71_06610 [Gammaproteobacteria bacterium RIFCSPHIGHO2_02_FULL_42_43]OGT27885.1 MAG: hypothetical protein A2624_02510 [Gammaproteobacteria bacterium RIFCSPHIGHO2_01_FULL_42_8]OGT52553.1 MAG: hypothetical protein A3E54_06215 [Gammaproteobacteria bacterium RIFCSPHIGHO2_12_FULL_41_25]OGT63151.1 MAG: hypothetical protein A3I77_06020 [Gammaproteobacteria bacterium RIFCSPLOWO2_02_FULL_42_14]OGT86651.1 MAG: hypothetical protein A3G86_04840 [Gammaproteobacteria bacterium R
MKPSGLRFICLLFFALLGVAAYAQAEQVAFDSTKANQSYDTIQKKLKDNNDYSDLVLYVDELSKLQDDAKNCVSNSEHHLKLINELLKSTQTDSPIAVPLTPAQQSDSQYLKNKQQYYASQLSDCRLFIYRLQESITDYKDKMQQLSAYKILKRSTSIWEVSVSELKQSIENFDGKKLIQLSGFTLISENEVIVFFLLLVFFLMLALYVRNLTQRALLSMHQAHVLWRALFNIFSTFSIPVILLSYCSIYVNFIFSHITPITSLELSLHAIVMTLLSVLAVKFLFYPSPILPGLFTLPVELGRLFYRRITLLAWMLFASYLITTFFREQIISASLLELARTIFMTIVCAMGAWIFSLWLKMPSETRTRRRLVIFILTSMVTILSALIVTEWAGYHQLAIFIIIGLCLTVIYTVSGVALWRLVDVLYQWVDNKQFFVARKIHQIFGVKFNHRMHEISLIKFSARFVLLCLYVILILTSWNVSSNFVDLIVSGLMDGFKFVGIQIIPSRIILALIVFSVIFLVGRLIATSIARKHAFQGEEDTQIAISTITVYISFAVALLFALLVTGVDFTGLAIIAGALSVGVGLGLQNIVNNFVSGLILLIEKPIKPGDRIVIGKTEGFVRKIRIRSTQIATVAKEDVIVPNADLITQPVTNFMFLDRKVRIRCEVGVAYGSDVQLVKKLLLQVASQHPEVVKEEQNEPLVFFSSFGESSLAFHLWCVIQDVNKKFSVTSDLNFAIDAIFREHHISIAFPQLDVHITQSDKSR